MSNTFKWGIKKARTNKGFQFYESFTYSGVEYFLYDCVLLYDMFNIDTFIGKLVRIYETPDKEKKIKVVWFFRPSEIRNFLGDYEPKWNELFLASGQGIGISNVNPLESIIKKCKVVCASNDKRNPQATEEELGMADFIFHRSFDVGKQRILDDFAEHIDGYKVEVFFNKRKDKKVMGPPAPKLKVKVADDAVRDGKSSSSPVARESKVTAGLGLQEHISNENMRLRPSKVLCSQVDNNAKKVSFRDSLPPNANASWPVKKRKLPDIVGPEVASDGGLKTVTARPYIDKTKWFKQQPWSEKLQRAEEAGTLVLLENLDPSLASSEVEDLVWRAFKLRVEAKIIQRSTFSSPHYGKAFVVFGSKDAALSAISKLQRRCLVITDGRPIVGSRGSLKDPGQPVGFIGHIELPEIKKKQTEEMRKAVSTAHPSQSNTAEYEMAIEWRTLQEQSDMWWKELHRRQTKEIEDAKSSLKMKFTSEAI